MAKQESFIKLRGKMGDLSFYKDRNQGYRARLKGGVDASRIATDPNFQRTRENMAEFGRAANMAKKIRKQLNNLLFYFGDRSVGNRLTSLVHRIQKADTVSPRGERKFTQENSGMLRGFECNKESQLESLFSAELSTSYDRTTGEASLVIPLFNPQNAVTLLQGATHIQFVFAAAELDLESDFPRKPETIYSESIPLIGEYPGDTLDLTLQADPDHAVFLLVGIRIHQEVNGGNYTLNNAPFNALTIVAVHR